MSLVLPRNAIILLYNTLLYNFCSFICQVIAQGRLKTKENCKLICTLILDVHIPQPENWLMTDETPNFLVLVHTGIILQDLE